MAVGDAHVFPGFLTPVLAQLSFQSHRLLFSHTSAEVRGENTPERKFASTGSRIHNHQVIESDTLTTEPLGGAPRFLTVRLKALTLYHTITALNGPENKKAY